MTIISFKANSLCSLSPDEICVVWGFLVVFVCWGFFPQKRVLFQKHEVPEELK